jgi:hypothetical protein
MSFVRPATETNQRYKRSKFGPNKMIAIFIGFMIFNPNPTKTTDAYMIISLQILCKYSWLMRLVKQWFQLNKKFPIISISLTSNRPNTGLKITSIFLDVYILLNKIEEKYLNVKMNIDRKKKVSKNRENARRCKIYLHYHPISTMYSTKSFHFYDMMWKNS